MFLSVKTPQRLFGFHPSERVAECTGERCFTASDYASVWQGLCRCIDSKSFFNGTITLHLGDCTAELTTTLIIYRAKTPLAPTPFEDIVPVWWQMRTFRTNGHGDRLELPNDFSLKSLLGRFLTPKKERSRS